MPVVVLESVALGASPAVVLHEAASTSVAPVDGTSDRGRDMPGGRVRTDPGRVILRRALPRRARPTESSGLQPLELLGDGFVDDRGEIAVRHFRAQKCPKALELVAQLGARRELDLVPLGSERLEKGTGCRGGRWYRALTV
jgi:hypothetical protein